ncbi:MAG: cell division protein FtsH [Planctomycetota bacterium]
MDDDEVLTAYHEAGHAVVGYALGARIESIQLGGEADDFLPERFGDCRINWGRIDPSIDWQRRREVLAILAGPVAEMIYLGEAFHPAFFGPWQSDWQQAWQSCRPMTADDSSCVNLLTRCVQSLHGVLQREPYWSAVAALADEIAAHELIESEQVVETLEFWLRR